MAVILARVDLEEDTAVGAIEAAFRYADEAELCALYRSLAFLPGGERFAWRAGEGCRTNMMSVFEAVACDTPYPALHFDEIAWRQLFMKSIFVGAPVWRIYGIEDRHSEELVRMALDYVEEKRSAGRSIPPGLWLCLGETPGERGIAALMQELEDEAPNNRRGAALALARAGESERLEEIAKGSRENATLAREVLGMPRPTARDYAALHEEGG